MNTDQIQKIKLQLQQTKIEIENRIQDLKKADPFSDKDHSVDNAAVDTDVREQEGHNLIEAEVETLQQRVNDIGEALDRIEQGRYGYCSKCGKQIPDGRLQLIPEAKFCVDCESQSKI